MDRIEARGVRVVEKTSWFWRALGWMLRPINPDFLTEYATTIGPWIAQPEGYAAETVNASTRRMWSEIALLHHESLHVDQCRWLGAATLAALVGLVASLVSPWLLFAAPFGNLILFWPFGAAVVGIPLNAALYLLVPIPVGLAYCRWVMERYACRAGYRVMIAHGWARYDLVEQAVEQLSTSKYGWTWPERLVRRWFLKHL